jgi:hypothetical protein
MAKELAKVEEAQIPDYIKQGQDRGSEDVGMEDLVIPRLEIVQSLSPCRDKQEDAYIEGAEEGMLYNNVSRQLYGESVKIVPVIFKKQWLIWRSRKLGGGFRGAYTSMEEANEVITDLVNEDPANNNGLEAIDTAQHLCLLLHDNGRYEEIAISMSKSKMKVSRQLNSLVRMAGGDRFSRVYEIRGVSDSNDKGDKFKNLGVKQVGFPSESIYKAAEGLYEAISSGEREIKVSSDQEESTDTKNNAAF